MTSTDAKIATCCYCGTRAALRLTGETRRELTCGACGAPLHHLKPLKRPTASHPKRAPKPVRTTPSEKPPAAQTGPKRRAPTKGRRTAPPKRPRKTKRHG